MANSQDSLQTVQGTNAQNTCTPTSVNVPAKEHDQGKDQASAIEVTGIAMAAIFGFMFIFFLVIKGIDKVFPYKEEE